jgi:hypothetical protein
MSDWKWLEDIAKEAEATKKLMVSTMIGGVDGSRIFQRSRIDDELFLIKAIREMRSALEYFAYEMDWFRFDIKNGQELRSKARTVLEKLSKG